MGPADKAQAPSSGNKPNGAALSSIHRERLLHLSLALIGQKVVATLTDGAVLEGVFHTFTPFDGLEAEVKNKYVLNTVQVVKPGKDNSIKTGSTVVLAVDKVAQLYAKNINLDRPNKSFANKGANQEFETDTQISATRGGGNRDLVAAGSAWTSAPGGKQTRAEALAGALDDPKGRNGNGAPVKDTSGLKGNIGGWDQFKANQKLFNVNASYDENLYTTELDKSQIDSRKIAEAERIAREIETTTSSNFHIAEERGQALETDYDEEDRYSGVLTKEGKQRHEDKSAAAGAPKKIMNYAAAAAKADAAKKAAPSGLGGKAPATAVEAKPSETAGTSDDKKVAPAPAPKPEEAKKEEKDTEASKDAVSAPKPADETKDETKTDESEDKKGDETKDTKPSTKLNANAKSFTFNPSAKSFTPTFGMGGASFGAPQQQPQQMPDPNMQVHAGGHPMQHPHYMHAQMGQPGKHLSLQVRVVMSCLDMISHSNLFTHIFYRNDANDEPPVPGHALSSSIRWNGPTRRSPDARTTAATPASSCRCATSRHGDASPFESGWTGSSPCRRCK
jgi:PAB1-binding protein PBP1